MIWLLLVIIALLLMILWGISGLNKTVQDQRGDHAKCIAVVTKFVGDEWAARVLHDAALRYDEPEGQVSLKRIANHEWRVGGPSVPAMWMSALADEIKGQSQSDVEVHTLAGERAV